MYVWIGRVDVHPPYSFSWAWNPPGWGSTDVGILEFARQFNLGDVRKAMVVGIRAKGYIPFHVDDLTVEKRQAGTLERVHVILQTNRHCWNFHDGLWQQLDEGGLYTMDPGLEHASINLGDTDRYHLVVDRVPSVDGV